MAIRYAIISLSMLALAAMGFGCSDDHDDMMSANGSGAAAILRVYPAEGATGISTSASVAVKFDRKMDTMSVMNNLYLMGGQEMHDWMDTVAHHGGFGQMSMGDMDHMMNWMDSMAMPGIFSWNEAMDSCEFAPTTGMIANEEHMIFINESSMMDHKGEMMGSDQGHEEFNSYHFMAGQ